MTETYCDLYRVEIRRMIEVNIFKMNNTQQKYPLDFDDSHLSESYIKQ